MQRVLLPINRIIVLVSSLIVVLSQFIICETSFCGCLLIDPKDNVISTLSLVFLNKNTLYPDGH